MLLATVTSTAPLTVRSDGSQTSAPATISGAPALANGDRVIVIFLAGKLHVISKVGATGGSGGGGGAINADTLDGLDSTYFASSAAVGTALAGKLGTTAKAADSELLDGLDSTAFLQTDRFLRRRGGIGHWHGGGIIKWDGTTFSWSDRFIWIPSGKTQYFQIDAGSKSSGGLGWAFFYIRAADANFATNGMAWAASSVQVESYTTYQAQENDIPLAVINSEANDGRLFLADGRVIDKLRTPTYESGWVDFSTTSPARYWKDSSGIVHWQGVIKSGTLGNKAVYAAAGYRPAVNRFFILNAHNGTSYQQHPALVYPDGGIAPAGNTNVQVALDAISYLAEA